LEERILEGGGIVKGKGGDGYVRRDCGHNAFKCKYPVSALWSGFRGSDTI
jgi:hypothetical protein